MHPIQMIYPLLCFKGSSGAKKLQKSGNNFERGKTDVFTFECADIGIVKMVVEELLCTN